MRRALIGLSWTVALASLPLSLAHAVGTAPSRPDAGFPLSVTWAAYGLLIASCVAGAIANRNPARPIGKAVSASFFVVLASSVLVAARVVDHRSGAAPGTADAVFLVALALAIGELLVVALRRLGSNSNGVVIDSMIIGLGAWIVVWVILINPSFDDSTSALLVSSRAAALGAAIIVLFLLATILFSDTAPPPALVFAGLAALTAICGVVVRAVAARIGEPTGLDAWIDAAFVATLPLAGASLLHPTVDRIMAPARALPATPLMTRLTTTTASLVAPIIVLALIDPSDTRDRAVRTSSVCILAAVVMARIVQSARSNARTQEHLVRNALTDSLTGLPNRALMLDHIEQALSGARKTRRQPTVLFIDVDRFKKINDSLGHSAGDSVLTAVAARLLGAVGPGATVARIAGDEFVVLDATTENATQSVLLAEKILDAFTEPIATGGGDMFVTASVGVAHAPRGVALGAEDLMRHADAAMYRAKDAGRNCIALFDDSMLETVTRRLEIETALYKALERRELLLVHQPIVDIELGIVVGFEALMRWNRGDEGVVPPGDFIPIAEETGTIVPLGSWALRDALGRLRSWIDEGVCPPSSTMSVNVSPRQLQDPHFVNNVAEALAASGMAPEHLWLEVTESVMITEPTQTIGTLHRLASLGVRIAIDDFGTGYSSLSLLQQFPVHCIKIDRAFVEDIVSNEGTRSIVRTIIAMAGSLGAEVVAEGVETDDQLSALRELDCTRAQGYLISKPVPSDRVAATVAAIHDPRNLEILRDRITWADQPS